MMNITFKTLQLSLLLALTVATACNAQTKKTATNPIGGECNDCEALLEYDPRTLTSIDTLPLYNSNEPKLKITGKVYQQDGITPAPGVIIYVYQTNREGQYQLNGDEEGWAKRHGFIRGWVKTDAEGNYAFYTFRPASYGPEEHIHVTVKEPGKNPYIIDDFLFDDDPKLTQEVRSRWRNKGGSGIIMPKLEQGILTAYRNIILGLNIENYD